MLRRSVVRFPAPGWKRPFKHQFAVVGSGPSGCYVADYLTKKNPNIHVDVYEKLPVPFGLSRYGVAPDHPEVKNVEKKFLEMFETHRASLVCNLDVGKVMPMTKMLEHYIGVIIATGCAQDDRVLGIPGEHLFNVISARQLVEWYNTVPAPFAFPKVPPFDLKSARHVVIIGNGNVAIDCARVLLAGYKHFCPTDMNSFAIRELMASTVETVTLCGRRGVEHSAFTTKEFRELTKLENVDITVDPFDLPAAVDRAGATNRVKRRQLELLHKFTPTEKPVLPPEDESTARKKRVRRLHVRYNIRPEEIVSDERKKVVVGGVKFFKTHPGGTSATTATSEATDVEAKETHATIPCDVVIRSVGYMATAGIRHVPFNAETGTYPHEKGRIVGAPRLFCSGWCKTGPKGVIVNTHVDAQETAETVLKAYQEPDFMDAGDCDNRGKAGFFDYWSAKGLFPVSISMVKRIYSVEKDRGLDLGKESEKVADVQTMTDLARGGVVGKRSMQNFRGVIDARGVAQLWADAYQDDGVSLVPEGSRIDMTAGLETHEAVTSQEMDEADLAEAEARAREQRAREELEEAMGANTNKKFGKRPRENYGVERPKEKTREASGVPGSFGDAHFQRGRESMAKHQEALREEAERKRFEADRAEQKQHGEGMKPPLWTLQQGKGRGL